jgi:ABC-type antimicrobial peptide transport system permease subunit
VSLWGPLANYSEMEQLETGLNEALVKSTFKNKYIRYYDFNGEINETYSLPTPDAISIFFVKLDRIRDFEKYLYKTFNSEDRVSKIQLDDNQVKEKENFNFLSNVTKIISTLLVTFSTLAIMLFIFNLLKSHLSKVKMNIGTFKALGLSDQKARNTYFSIILIFVLMGLFSAFLSSWIAGSLLNLIMKRNLVVNKDINYFRLLDWKTVFTMVIIVTSSIVTSWITIRNLLSKTPGDLIYNR